MISAVSGLGRNVSPDLVSAEYDDVEIVMLLQGSNLFGDSVYSYLKLTGASLREMFREMSLGHNFKPADYGEILEAGKNPPSAEVRERMNRLYHMIEVPSPARASSGDDSHTRELDYSKKYAGYPAAELIHHVVECRQAGRPEDPTVANILADLRREYGHPAYPLAASLERLAFGTSGPPIFPESMESDEVAVVDEILRRLAGGALTLGPTE
jgi:hypothetical protein